MRVNPTRERRRLRGALSGKSGRIIGLTSIAAPVVGLVASDLRKPDSMIRRLIGGAVARLLEGKTSKPDAIDITDKVEVIEDKGSKED
jgi:hypothetical protein